MTPPKTTSQQQLPASTKQPQAEVVQTTNTKVRMMAEYAAKLGVDERKLMDSLKVTCIRQNKDNKLNVSDEQMMAFLIVARRYNLDPFTNQIYAFPKDGGIVPIVGIDGFTAIANDHDSYNGFDITWSEKIENMVGAKPCPEWGEISVFVKGREHPVVIREHLDECYVMPRGGFSGPWQSHTKRMMRHKLMTQGFRVAFGITGIYDEDEAGRIIEVTATSDSAPAANKSVIEFRNGKKSDPAPVAHASASDKLNTRLSTIDSKIEAARCNLMDELPDIQLGRTNPEGEMFFLEELGNFGCTEVLELTAGQKEMFLGTLEGKLKEVKLEKSA